MVRLSTFLATTFVVPILASPLIGKRAACSADVEKLAIGIQQNIQAQFGERDSTLGIQDLFNSTTGSCNERFAAAKTTLLGFVNSGIQIRTNNQKIAPAGNAAIAGLAIVQNAQATELQLATSLTGDKTKDLATTNTLLQDFAGGTKQNMQNLLDATQGCTPADATAAAGVQAALAAGLQPSSGASNGTAKASSSSSKSKMRGGH